MQSKKANILNLYKYYKSVFPRESSLHIILRTESHLDLPNSSVKKSKKYYSGLLEIIPKFNFKSKQKKYSILRMTTVLAV